MSLTDGPVGGSARVSSPVSSPPSGRAGVSSPVSSPPSSRRACARCRWRACAAARRGALGNSQIPSRFDRRSDDFLCGTGTSERFHDRRDQVGDGHLPIPLCPQGCSRRASASPGVASGTIKLCSKQLPGYLLARPASLARWGILKFPTCLNCGSDDFLCGTGTSERFDDRRERSGERHRLFPLMSPRARHPR
jgi:hypothetical protein